MENDSIRLALEAISRLDTKILVASFALIGSIFASIGSILMGLWAVRMQCRTHRELIDEKRKEKLERNIYDKLNEFYGPFQQYLNISKEFDRIFRKGKPKEFAVLTYLLNPEQVYEIAPGKRDKVVLSDIDKQLLEQIFLFGQKMEDLIVEKTGLIEDPELRSDFKINPSDSHAKLEDNGLLALATVHFQIIRLAYSGKLYSDLERFKDYIFPIQLPNKIKARIDQLQSESRELNS